jgi:hypothetical protein
VRRSSSCSSVGRKFISGECIKGKRQKAKGNGNCRHAHGSYWPRYAEAMRIRSLCLCLSAFCLVLSIPSSAFADITGFVGTNRTPSNRLVKGFAIGTGLLVAGFEFEYSKTDEDLLAKAPRLRTFMFNGLAQTPIPVARMQFYGTLGGGIYRETLSTTSETNFGINVGGGVKVTLLGPLRLRLDYRVFTLRGEPIHSKPQRFYAGLNLKF